MRILVRAAAAAAIALVLAAAPARAQLSLGLMGGAALPMSGLADTHGTGVHAQLFLGVGVPLVPVKARLEGLHASFPGASVSGVVQPDARATGAALTLVYDLPVPVVTPYLLGGVGYYGTRMEDVSRSNGGWNAGAGLRLRLGALGMFVEARYFDVSTGAENLTFAPLTVGLTF